MITVPRYHPTQLGSYGDRLLTSIDAKIDTALSLYKSPKINALTSPKINASAEPATADAEATLTDEKATSSYWSQLKDKFMKSRWYLAVDKILSERHSVIRAVSNSIAQISRPAEHFYNGM
jgi:hypothetical protein